MANFDKDHYWTGRNLSAAEKKKVRDLDHKKLIVAVHQAPDWPAKPVGNKRAAARKNREMRGMIVSLNSELYLMNHPMRRHKPTRKNCYYCQETKIYKDGLCAGHWKFLFENMSNKDRMKEKAYHRKARAEELQRKREAINAQIDNIKQGVTPPKEVTA